MECERAELERGMRTRPFDDLPRLVFADWLEEEGFVDESLFLHDYPAAVWYGDGDDGYGDGYGDGGYGDAGDGGGSDGYGAGGYGYSGGGGYGDRNYGDGNSPQLITT